MNDALAGVALNNAPRPDVVKPKVWLMLPEQGGVATMTEVIVPTNISPRELASLPCPGSFSFSPEGGVGVDYIPSVVQKDVDLNDPRLNYTRIHYRGTQPGVDPVFVRGEISITQDTTNSSIAPVVTTDFQCGQEGATFFKLDDLPHDATQYLLDNVGLIEDHIAAQ